VKAVARGDADGQTDEQSKRDENFKGLIDLPPPGSGGLRALRLLGVDDAGDQLDDVIHLCLGAEVEAGVAGVGAVARGLDDGFGEGDMPGVMGENEVVDHTRIAAL